MTLKTPAARTDQRDFIHDGRSGVDRHQNRGRSISSPTVPRGMHIPIAARSPSDDPVQSTTIAKPAPATS